MTFAFNIDEVFQGVLSKENDVLRYVVKDDPLGERRVDRPRSRRDLRGGGYLRGGASRIS